MKPNTILIDLPTTQADAWAFGSVVTCAPAAIDERLLAITEELQAAHAGERGHLQAETAMLTAILLYGNKE